PVFVLSAKTSVQLKDYAKKWDLFLESSNNMKIELGPILTNLQLGRTHLSERLAIIVDSIEDLKTKLRDWIHQDNHSQIFTGSAPKDTLNKSAFSIHSSTPMTEICHAWVEGRWNTWESLSFGSSVLKIELPTIPFQCEVYCISNHPVVESSTTGSCDILDSSQASQNLILQEQVFKIVQKEITAVFEIPAIRISLTDTWEEYGTSSILIVRFIAQLENHFGDLPKTILFEYQTVQGSCEYLGKLHNAATEFLELKTTEDHQLQNRPVEKISISNSESFDIPAHDSIAIIGMSGRYPESNTLNKFWENLKAGKNCIREIPGSRWNHSLYFDSDPMKTGKTYSKWGGFIEGADQFDPLFFNISPREAEYMDPQERLFLEIAFTAIEDAGYTRSSLRSYQKSKAEKNVGVYVGIMYSEYQLYGAQATMSGNPISLSGNPGSIANRISYFGDFNGPSMVIDNMCTSSLTAIHLACQSILQGECSAAIAGGVNLSIHPNKYLGLAQVKLISGTGICGSFGEGGDGFIPGEGVGAIVLKTLKDAIRDNDNIYGVILGSSINHGGKTNGYTVPNPNAQAKVIEGAIKKARINAEMISYVEAHGTGTELGDPIEIAGLTKAFSQYTHRRQYCLLGSVKSNTGHCESAAGIIGLTKVLLQMKHGLIVPSLHSSKLNPNIDFNHTPFVVNQELREWERPVIDDREIPRIAGISSFGSGGSNAHVIIQEYQKPTTASMPLIHVTNEPIIFPLSARTPEQLLESAKNLLSFIQEYAVEPISKIPNTPSVSTLQAGIESTISQLLQIETAPLDSTQEFMEYGLERVHQIALLESLQKEYSVVLNKQEFMEKTSIESLVHWLIEKKTFVTQVQSHQNHPPAIPPLDIVNLSYTLQIGREAMEERLGFIVTSVKELEEKLEVYLSGNQEIEDHYQGQVKRNKEMLGVFTANEELQEAIEKWIQRRKFSNILHLWVNGLVFDWNKLYGENKPKRISLPTYPFARERYWISESENVVLNDQSSIFNLQSQRVHPLLHENTSDLSEQRFTSTFTGKEFFLKDHQVKGEKVFPGVGYLEMARAAVEKASGEIDQGTTIHFKNVVWAQPIVANCSAQKVHIGLYGEESSQIQYKVYTESDNEEESIVHSQGIAEFRGKSEIPALDIRELQSQMNKGTLNADSCYQAFKEMGIDYGEGHRGIEEIYQGEDQVLAKLSLPSSVQDTQSDYVLHPSLMDAALQSSIGLMLEKGVLEYDNEAQRRPALPFALESLEILSPCSSEMYAWVHYSDGSAATDKVQKLDIDLCDEQGNVCVKMRGLTLQELEITSQGFEIESKGFEKMSQDKKTVELSPSANDFGISSSIHKPKTVELKSLSGSEAIPIDSSLENKTSQVGLSLQTSQSLTTSLSPTEALQPDPSPRPLISKETLQNTLKL
ncbi:MAG: hypothetical protein GY941_24570, partial [Planctomycetes bacterium]|nr:hypothetical protein [Planctomycetota bacterium]